MPRASAAAASDDDADGESGAEGSPRFARPGSPAAGRELRARGQRTVRKLLDASFDVFATRGYHASRVDDIVKAAKTSHGTFYLYFANKEDVLRALLLDVADALATHAETLGDLTPDASGRTALHEWLLGFTDEYDRYAPVITAWVEAEIDTHEFGQLGAEVLGRFAGVITERIASSAAVVSDPANAATVVVAMIERCTYYLNVGQIRAERRALVDTMTDAIHAALFGPTPRG